MRRFRVKNLLNRAIFTSWRFVRSAFVSSALTNNSYKCNENAAEKKYSKNFDYGCLWEIRIPNIVLDMTFTPEQEKNVLLELFNQTDGHRWKNNSLWGNDSVSHCSWYGVTCDNSTHSYVISIALYKNNLRGKPPSSLWKLRNLQGLCLYGNSRLSGELHDFLSPNMTSLLRLSVAFNKHSGTIPGEILVGMKSLVKIQLCCQMGEGLAGEIPRDIGNLKELRVLSLGQNNLNGSIPKSIGQLKKLGFLDLEAASLTTGFENLFNLSSLQYLHLSLAKLRGTLPENFGIFFPEMVQCLLPGNFFNGSIPSSVGNMTKLKQFDIAANKFSGQIPKSIGALPQLHFADFSGNQLTSLEPGIKFKSQSMELLLLNSNSNLTMKFSALLDALEPANGSLRILNISDCNFYDEIPTKLWDFRSLIAIDLENNRLSGLLPGPTENFFMSLFHFDVSGNSLSGEIPAQFARLQVLQYLDVSGNPLMHDDEYNLPHYMKVATLMQKHSSGNFRCPQARLNFNDGLVALDPEYYGYRFCVCDVGYYGRRSHCLPCMEGGVCQSQTLHYQRMIMKTGYWPSSGRDNNVTHLVKCSSKLGISSFSTSPCNPNGTCDCQLKLFKDSNGTEAKPGTVCSSSCLCHNGNKDRFCSKCEDGFYKEGVVCKPCKKNNTSVYILICIVLALGITAFVFGVLYERRRLLSVLIAFAQVIILLVLAMLDIIPGWFFELNTVFIVVGLAGRGKDSRGILKITVFYLQTLDALTSNTNIWPLGVLETQQFLSSIFNLRFSGFACVFPDLFTPLGELILLVVLPVASISVLWFYFSLVSSLVRLWQPFDRLLPSRSTCLQLCIICLNLTYFPIVKKTVSLLAECDEDSGYHYLREAPWQECHGHVYTVLQALAYVALIIYVIGVPFGLFLPLLVVYVRNRENLDVEEQQAVDNVLGSIFLPYKEQFRSYFEIFFLLKRMLLAFFLSFIPQVSTFQTIAVSFVLLVFLCLQLLLWPYVDSYQKIPLENTAETLVLFTLHFSFTNARYVFLNATSSMSIVWILIVINLVVLCFIFISVIVLLGTAREVANADDEDEVGDGVGAGDADQIPGNAGAPPAGLDEAEPQATGASSNDPLLLDRAPPEV
ncbi:putative leucine-rich repeat-containing protein DDB_G0281931 [Montipora capricornis]|uniref:putative leucine-rich repeat-containing protein DDB_G0281931 n=1 Tax=Montipora capricornis TaxID=246305 RepID=UPI0035F16761